MELKVLGSSSSGNCYFLENDKEILILECGIPISKITKALGNNFNKVVGCLVTHLHKDHSKSIKELVAYGVDVYASGPTYEEFEHHRAKVIKSMESFSIGGFNILPFDIVHDVQEPLGFLISHSQIGKLLFATDTAKINYSFNGLNHVLIECNFSDEIINNNVEKHGLPAYRMKRVKKTHMSLYNCMEFVRKHAYGSENVVLLHLSEGNSNAEQFEALAKQETKANVFIAKKGLTIPLTEDYGF